LNDAGMILAKRYREAAGGGDATSNGGGFGSQVTSRTATTRADRDHHQQKSITSPARSAGPLRFKLGDAFEGFRLSEIRDKNVVFTKGASRVELALDYFRKVEPTVVARAPISQPALSGTASATGQARPGAPLAPRVVPQLPRRERLPAPPASR
jgi:hypothetical protein